MTLNFTLEDTRNELELVTPVYFQLTSAAAELLSSLYTLLSGLLFSHCYDTFSCEGSTFSALTMVRMYVE